MGTRSLATFFNEGMTGPDCSYKFRYGYCSDHPQSGLFHHWHPLSFDPDYKNEEKFERELGYILNPELENYSWFATVRHPFTRFKSILNWWLAGDENSVKRGQWAMEDPTIMNQIFIDYLTMHKLSDLKDIKWIRTENMAEDVIQFNIDTNKYPKFINSYKKNILKNQYKKNRINFDINDLDEKIGEYLYKKYNYIYKKFNYDKFPQNYKNK